MSSVGSKPSALDSLDSKAALSSRCIPQATNASHECNLKTSSSHIRMQEEASRINVNNIFV